MDKDQIIEQLKTALDSVPSYVYMKDLNSCYFYANKLTLELFGVTEAQLIGKPDTAFFDEETSQQLREIDLNVFAGQSNNQEIQTFDKNNIEKTYIEVKTPIYKGGSVIGLLGISTDISAQKRLEKQVTHLSLTDPLTNLPNRRHLAAHFEQRSTHPKRARFSALLFIDLNNFKPVNDQYGHDVGDKALKIIARRLQGELREIDYVARLGGDEFVAILEHLDEVEVKARQQVDNVISRIHEHITRTIKLADISLSLSASIGVVLFAGNAHNLDDLLKQADNKMYENKLGT